MNAPFFTRTATREWTYRQATELSKPTAPWLASSSAVSPITSPDMEGMIFVTRFTDPVYGVLASVFD